MGKRKRIQIVCYCALSLAFIAVGCSSDSHKSKDSEAWIPPITEVVFDEITDSVKVEKGKSIFETNCIACHNMKSKMIGPALGGVLERRPAAWVMNMILHPEKMLVYDAEAKKLLEEYQNIPMTNSGLSEDEAQNVMEFIKTWSH